MFWLAKCSWTCIELTCTKKNLQFVTSRNIWASSDHLVVTLMEFDTSGGHFRGQIMAICGEGHD